MLAQYVNTKEEAYNNTLSYFPGSYFLHDNNDKIIIKNAIFECKKTWFGTVISPKMELNLPCGNLSTVTPEIYFNDNFKKIPFELLNQIIDFFKKVHQEQKTEAQAEIWYNLDEQKYFIHIHDQVATYASVERNNDIPNDFSMIKNVNVLNLHSHHEMSAFWSTTDDENDKGGILYAVIGDINNKIPSILFRTIANNYEFDIGIDKIFDIPENFEIKEYPRNDEWHNKVHIITNNDYINTYMNENNIIDVINKNNTISYIEEYLYDLIDVYSKLEKDEQQKIFNQILSVTKK